MTQLRESREKPGSAREVRDHCHGDSNSVYSQTTGHSFLSAIGGISWLQSAIAEVGMLVDLLLPRVAQVPEIGGEMGLWSETPEMGMMTTEVATKL